MNFWDNDEVKKITSFRIQFLKKVLLYVRPIKKGENQENVGQVV